MKYLFKFNSDSLNENVAQANSLLKKLKISESDPDYLKIRKMLKGHDGYVYWFTNLRFSDNQSMEDITNVWNIIKDENGITSFFTKKIVELKSMEDFWDQYEASKLFSIAKKVINQFPARQKAFFNLKDQTDLDLLIQLGKSKSLPALIKKISSFRDKKTLLEASNRLLTSSFDGKFGELLKLVNNTGADLYVADEENNIIICQVNYEQIKKLGGDTSWCIVRSEGTFNSYANGGMQWVVFLVDNFGGNDRLSKIGITTNIGYITAHDKYDGYITKEALTSLLKERDVNLHDLYFSKEYLLSMSDWTQIPVEALILRKVSKEIIIKRKTIFKNKNSYRNIENSDINYFSEEEIDKWDLLNRTELQWDEVSRMKFDYVIKVNALSRLTQLVNIITISENYKLTKEDILTYKLCENNKVSVYLDILLNNLNFTKDDIIKHKLYNAPNVMITKYTLSHFTKDELVKYKIVDKANNIPLDTLINIGFTKKEILNKYPNILDGLSKIVAVHFKGKTKKEIISIIDRMWRSDYEEIDVDYEDKDKFKLLTLSIYDIDSNSMSIKSLVNYFSDRLSIKKENLDTLINLGHKPTLDNIDDYFNLFLNLNNTSIKNLSDIGILRNLLKDNKEIYDLCTKKLNNITNNRLYFDYYSLIENKPYLVKLPEWKNILNTMKIQMLSASYKLSTKLSYNSTEYSYENTVKFIKELEINKKDIELIIGISKFVNIFSKDKVDNDLIDKVINLIKSYDIEVNKEVEIIIIKNLINYVEKTLDKEKIFKEEYYKLLIDRGIDTKDSISNLYEYYFKRRTNLSLSEERQYKEFFQKCGDEWIEIFNNEVLEIKKKELNLNVIQKLKNLYSYRGSSIIERNSWYDNYFQYYKDIPQRTHSFDKNTNDIRVLWILASIDKFDDFNKITDWSILDDQNSRGFSFDNNLLHSLAKSICGFGSDVREIKLTNEDLLKIYEWLLTKVDITKPWVNKYLSVCYYLFDKDRYNKFIEVVSRLKNNYNEKTLRINEFRYILKYFREKDDYDSFIELIDKLLSFKSINKKDLKMSKAEYELTLKYIDIWSNDRSEFGRKLTEYIKDNKIIKESFILKWDDYKSKK